jgi:hypothetical protein
MVCGHNSNRLQAVGSPATSACSALTPHSQEFTASTYSPYTLLRCGPSSPPCRPAPSARQGPLCLPILLQSPITSPARCCPRCEGASQCSWTTLRCAGRPYRRPSRGWLCGSPMLALRWPYEPSRSRLATRAMQHNPNTLIDLLCCDAHGYQVQSRQPHADVHCLP